MAASGFLPQSQPFRPSMTSQASYSLANPATHSFDRDATKAVYTPYGATPSTTSSILIRRLPMNTSEESLRLMTVFSKELLDVDLLPPEHSEDVGFRSAIMNFETPHGAQEAKNMLDGKSNISNNAKMIVEVLNGGPISGRRYVGDAASAAALSTNPSTTASSAASSVASSRATSSVASSRGTSRFTGTFSSLDKISPPLNGVYVNGGSADLANSEPSAHYQTIFSPQSPIGNHLADGARPRISSKSLINNDAAHDDETGELLKDPVAYAENSAIAAQQRRATAPGGLPIQQRMGALPPNTNPAAGPASMPPYGHQGMGPMSAAAHTMSPVAMSGTFGGNQHYRHHNFPPVNPAGQNPPCNTLYVGNLPIDTSEEELKAMFSKQRGYKRLCFRTKQNGPMCFVEFEDVSFATKALHDLYGHMLHNSVKGGIRLSFSKNPLGVRSGQTPGQNSWGPMSGMNWMMSPVNGFTTANAVADSGHHSSLRGKQSVVSEAMLGTRVMSATPLGPVAELPEPARVETSEVPQPMNDSIDDRFDKLVESFAKWLLEMIHQRLGEIPSSDVLAILPDILQEFAIRLGHEGKTRDHRKLMYVAHKPAAYRTIAKLLEARPSAEDQTSREIGSTYKQIEARDANNAGSAVAAPNEEEYEAGMDWKERITTLLYRPAPDHLSDKAEDAHPVSDPYDAYRQILKDADASVWLLTTLNRDLTLRGIVPSAMHAVRKMVLETLRRYEPYGDSGGKSTHVPRQKISPDLEPLTYIAHFELRWDPITFLNQEFLGGDPRELISQVITVTGEGDTFQALPCQEYIMQTWPFGGPNFLALIQSLVAEPHERHEVPLSRKGGSWLKARIEKGNLCLDTKGTDFEVAEVAEQLAWLGSALQSPGQPRYCVYEPELSTFFRGSLEPFFLIDFLPTPLIAGQPDSSQCWKTLFENMAIARGFPIPSRPNATPGLEIPLDIAADILGAEKVVLFKARLLIKGFSTILYPTKVDFEDGTILWHLLESDKETRISYADPRVGNGLVDGVDGLRYEDLQRARNIIGWCQDVENVTGTSRANYAIRISGLDSPPRGWVLEKLQISGGQYITPSFVFSRGKRIRVLKLSRDKGDLIARMEWLADKQVILHDTLDRRAWLVDGPSALLHLVRASLRADSRLYRSQKYSTVLDRLQQPQDRYAGRAASMEILTDRENLKLELRNKEATTNQNGGDDKYRFRDRVGELLGILEQMIDHQADMKDGEGIGFKISRSPWNRLEGFDFTDIARRSDPFNPKGVVLKDDGRGWVGFTRAIHAITLFGHGFGDLLCPIVTERSVCGRCHWNSSPPKDRDILAVSIADLEYLHYDVPEWEGTEPGARTVFQKFIWERPASCFAPCVCVLGQVSPPRIQPFRKNSEGLTPAWAKREPPPDSGEVSRRGGVLLGIHRSLLHKTTPTVTADTPQDVSLARDGVHREQRTPSLSSRDGSRYASTYTTSTSQTSNSTSIGDVRSPAIASSTTEEDEDRGDRQSRMDFAPPSRREERAIDDNVGVSGRDGH